MAEPFFGLSGQDQREVLEIANQRTGRPAHLLEKDTWVVWVLHTLFDGNPQLGVDLTFKGGTSLSKAYRIIYRFSEDIDLTYDIRRLIPDLVTVDTGLPGSRSQAEKWTRAVRTRLPRRIRTEVLPRMQQALARQHLDVRIEQSGAEQDKLLLHYAPHRVGTGYVAPVVTLEFGARATGEPHQVLPVLCDMAGHVDGVSSPPPHRRS